MSSPRIRLWLLTEAEARHPVPCAGCGELIVWTRTAAGKRMPLTASSRRRFPCPACRPWTPPGCRGCGDHELEHPNWLARRADGAPFSWAQEGVCAECARVGPVGTTELGLRCRCRTEDGHVLGFEVHWSTCPSAGRFRGRRGETSLGP